MKRSKLLLVAGILGGAYLIYLISYFTGSVATSEGAEAIGAGIATAIAAGGPGAVFWMWVTALIGGASAFAERQDGQLW